jgi:hypothetical protein
MMNNAHRSAVVCLTLCALAPEVSAQEFAPQKPRDAVRAAKSFVSGLESPGKCPVDIDAALDGAVGVVVRPDTLPFFLFVPQKGLEKTDFQGKEIRKGYGVPVGYLFPFWTPDVDGQLIDRRRMQNTVYQDPKAGRIDFNCIVLTAGRKEDDGYVLHAFGTGAEPLFSVPLAKSDLGRKVAGKALTSVLVKDLDVQSLRLKLELTFNDGRRALIPFGTPRRPGE